MGAQGIAHFTTMAGTGEVSFARQVSLAMCKIAPLSLADGWDNVGLILEPPTDSLSSPTAPVLTEKALLCIDMTEQVAEDAARGQYGAVIAYHPPIFSGLKKVTQAVSLQRAVLRCAREGIAIFSPHTALDTVVDGVNDFLADGLPEGERTGCTPHEKVPDAQVGRVVTFESPKRFGDIVEACAKHLHMPSGALHVCYAVGSPGLETEIRSVAVCAGSGSSVVTKASVDCYLTGEMSHHEQLAASAAGVSIILCGHTETERPYLPVLQRKLMDHGILSDIAKADRSPLNFLTGFITTTI